MYSTVSSESPVAAALRPGLRRKASANTLDDVSRRTSHNSSSMPSFETLIMRRIMRQTITHKNVAKRGEKDASHKRPFLRQANPTSEFPAIKVIGHSGALTTNTLRPLASVLLFFINRCYFCVLCVLPHRNSPFLLLMSSAYSQMLGDYMGKGSVGGEKETC